MLVKNHLKSGLIKKSYDNRNVCQYLLVDVIDANKETLIDCNLITNFYDTLSVLAPQNTHINIGGDEVTATHFKSFLTLIDLLTKQHSSLKIDGWLRLFEAW